MLPLSPIGLHDVWFWERGVEFTHLLVLRIHHNIADDSIPGLEQLLPLGSPLSRIFEWQPV
jgi:hypothetical protein